MSSPVPVLCPACGLPLAESDRAVHLVAVHGYVEIAGITLPRPTALSQLWDRVFAHQDARAHARLCELLIPDSADEPSPYAAALEAEIAQRAGNLLARRHRELSGLIGCLRENEAARPFFWRLLQSADPQVRELGQELILPEVGQQLAGAETSAADVRAWLDRLCPDDDIWDKIRLCQQRLRHHGVNVQVLRECLRQLQQERPVACSECGVAVPIVHLETHLRRVHHLYRFRGVPRSLEETLTAMLTAVCGPTPDFAAWEELEALARDEWPEQTESALGARLVRFVKRLERPKRPAAVLAVAEALAGSEMGSQLTAALAEVPGLTARHLALAAAGRLSPPMDRALVTALRPFLKEKRVPRRIRLAAAATLLRSVGASREIAREILQALIVRTGKARAVERLRQLEQQVGSSPLIEELCVQLETLIRLRCPRCRVQLQRPDMARHVWEEHGLLLYGRRVREPWRVVEDMIADYRSEGNPELLARCRALAQRLDPERGLLHCNRLWLANGIEDPEARQALLQEAAQQRASLCPRCFTLLAVSEPVIVRSLNQSHGRLSMPGYLIEVSEAGLMSRMHIEAAGRILFHGAEPGTRLTYRGATLLLAGPPVLAALLLAVLLPQKNIPPLVPVLLTLWLGLVAYVVVCLYWGVQPEAVHRAVDAAWTLLVPHLHAKGFSAADSLFLASLALTSVGRGRVAVRAAIREQVLHVTEMAVTAGTAPLAHLAALRRLVIEDAAAMDIDPVHLVVGQIGRCLDGAMPLIFAERFLAEWESDWWTPGNLARLRVLLCDRAFEGGLEVGDLLEAGRAAPALGAVLGVQKPEGLAMLRLLWSLRPHRPWERWGEAVSVFELADDPQAGRDLLNQYPDLLLVQQDAPMIVLTGRGVFFEDTLFHDEPPGVSLQRRRDERMDEFIVNIGEHRFWYPHEPAGLVGRLERMFRYYFHQFLPQVPEVYSWRAPGPPRMLRLQETVVCPHCRLTVLPRLGEVGIGATEFSAEGGTVRAIQKALAVDARD